MTASTRAASGTTGQRLTNKKGPKGQRDPPISRNGCSYNQRPPAPSMDDCATSRYAAELLQSARSAHPPERLTEISHSQQSPLPVAQSGPSRESAATLVGKHGPLRPLTACWGLSAVLLALPRSSAATSAKAERYWVWDSRTLPQQPLRSYAT